MARNRLSESNLKGLAKVGVHGDGDGLYLRVHPSGSKSWVFIYQRKRAGEKAIRQELGLGGYGQGTAPVSLRLAREKAEAIRQALARGEDPRSKKEVAKVITFKDCMDGLLHARRDDWTNDKHKAQYHMTLEVYGAPLHPLPVADITVGDVEACLLPHWTVRPETADRLRSRIMAVIDFGIARQWRTAANPAVWKGLLDKVMPKRQNLSRGHHAALPVAETPRVCGKLRESKGTSARAVEFLILTAARTSEAREATWDEIDFADAVWNIPASRMKNGLPHNVPLCDRALEILAGRQQESNDGFVFGAGSSAPVSSTAMTKALRVASPEGAHCTLHGLRSMFRDWCGDHTEFPRELAEVALSHTVGDRTERAYRRGEALEKRRVMMAAWGEYVGGS